MGFYSDTSKRGNFWNWSGKDWERYFFTDLAELFGDRAFDVNDYESMSYYSDKFFVGSYAKSQKTRLENEELERWKNDYRRNTGSDPNKSRYPIRKGLYSRPGDNWTFFDDSMSVLSLYSDLNRWF